MADKPMKMNPVVHFEMPAEDRKRMASFYSNVFGWQTQMLGPDMGNYVIAITTEADERGRPKNPGAINGGFFPKSNNASPVSLLLKESGASMNSTNFEGGSKF